MGLFPHGKIGLLLGGNAIVLDTPGFSAVVAHQNQPIVSHCPAARCIDEMDSGKHLGGRNLALLPAPALIVGEQNVPTLTRGNAALTRGGNVQQQRAGSQRHYGGVLCRGDACCRA